MKLAIIIPARRQSSRFPAKPLAKLRARDGVSRTLIEWCWHAACSAAAGAEVHVATDDEEIAASVRYFGGHAIMTDASLRNGTERCAAALAALDTQPDVVVNWQGDNPLVPTAMVDAIVSAMDDPDVAVATPYVRTDAEMTRRLIAENRAGSVGGTCVIGDADNRALYFSKYPIPHGVAEGEGLKMHIGLYAYRPDALAAYCARQPSMAEQAEGLEQLRFLDMGVPVSLVECTLPEGGLWEVNNPSDVPIVEALLPASSLDQVQQAPRGD